MKTATITLHSAHNNGSFLQAYALQKTIQSFGVNNEIINYVPPAQKNLYQNIVFKGLDIKSLIKGLLNVTHYSLLKKRKSRFNNSLDLLVKTEPFESENDVLNIMKRFDVLVAGSDQIWNIATMPDFTRLYLLPVNKRKVSYGPSFGKSLNNQFNDLNVVKLIKNFDYLSVREKSAQKKLMQLTHRNDIKIVLDPTFLLSKDSYVKIQTESKCKYQGDYIFFYCIKASNNVLNTVKNISELLGLPVVTVFTGVTTYKCQMYGQKIDFAAGPREFISYIQNAKYVISNSFHGVVFSIIYNKIFFRIAENDGGIAKVDERIDSLLDVLNLKKQTIIAGSKPNLNKVINYDCINKEVDVLRNESKIWLRNALMETPN